MGSCTLTLQPCSQQVEWINGGSTEGATEGAHTSGSEVAERNVIFGAAFYAGFARCEELLQIFESREIDGAIWEHADEAHGKTPIERAHPSLGPHLPSGREYQIVTLLAAFDSLILYSARSKFSKGIALGMRGTLTYNFNVSKGYMQNLERHYKLDFSTF